MTASDLVTDTTWTSSTGKVLPLADLFAAVEARRAGRAVVHCHGCFDLLHIGHIKHLESAKKLGDLLVVTVTPDRYVNKGPGRPAFNEQLRAEAVAALGCVDLVAINDAPTAVDTIRRLRPDLFVKGAEFRDAEKDHSGHIVVEEQAVRSVGGRLAFTDDPVFSSSNLINRYLSGLPDATRDYLDQFRQRYSAGRIIDLINGAQKLSVLVVGETIIDEYQYCQAIGKSSKEPVLAVKQNGYEKFAGGILAVGNHVADFAGRAGVVTMLGHDNPQQAFIEKRLHPALRPAFVFRDKGPTIVKRRFIDSYFFQKLFEVYECNDADLTPAEDERLCAVLREVVPQFDVVIVVDFGHGMLSPAAIDVICSQARFLVLNAQSNAGNLGYHAVSKYPRADMVCIAEHEMRLEARDRYGDLRPMVEALSARIGARRVAITRGSHGCLCYEKSEGFAEVPAVADTVKDRMGAGDTFIAVAGLCAAQEAPMELVGLIGNAAAAQAVATVGHRRYLQRVPLLKHLECLLK